jgi:hypothetical protein
MLGEDVAVHEHIVVSSIDFVVQALSLQLLETCEEGDATTVEIMGHQARSHLQASKLAACNRSAWPCQHLVSLNAAPLP